MAENIETFLAGLPAKTLARVILAAYENPSEGLAVAQEALARFGHPVPADIWAFASDGKIRDSQIAGRVKPGPSWLVEIPI
ncbi:MAG: hypothetical protein AAFQ18_00075 [Pseudomonadota bacterium]